jgi:hypothetical protein
MTKRATPPWVSTTALLAVIAFIVVSFIALALTRSTFTPPAPLVDYNGTGG